MTFIVLLLALLAERFLLDQREWRRMAWFPRYLDAFNHYPQMAWAKDHLLGAVAVLAPVLVGVTLLQWGIAAIFGGLVDFLFALAVLLYCLGPEDLDNQTSDFLYAQDRGEQERAKLAAAKLCDDEPSDSAAEQVNQVREAILYQANRRLFGVIFWFLILGPLGAFLYRLSRTLLQAALADGMGAEFLLGRRRLLWILDWLPARLLVIAFALAGNFENTLGAWRRWKPESQEDEAKSLLVQAGNGALMIADEDDEEANPAQVEAALSLVWRSMVVWLVILGLLAMIF